MVPDIFCGNCGRALKTACTLRKAFLIFLLYNCGAVAVTPRSVAETETLYLAYTLDFFALLQKLQINTIHLLLVTKYTFMRVENSVSISHVLLSSAEGTLC